MISMLAALMTQASAAVSLPEPRRDSDYSLERAFVERHSVREFGGAPLSLSELAQLAWAATARGIGACW